MSSVYRLLGEGRLLLHLRRQIVLHSEHCGRFGLSSYHVIKSCFGCVVVSAVMQPLAEICQRGRAVLIQELGLTVAMRFLSQFQVGHGDYAAEREQQFKVSAVKSIVVAIKAKRPIQPQFVVSVGLNDFFFDCLQ